MRVLACELRVILPQSATNYYGDSHLYLMTTDGRVSKQIILPKEGPIHAVAWCTWDPCVSVEPVVFDTPHVPLSFFPFLQLQAAVTLL
jgi:hypothetical protein